MCCDSDMKAKFGSLPAGSMATRTVEGGPRNDHCRGIQRLLSDFLSSGYVTKIDAVYNSVDPFISEYIILISCFSPQY